MDRPQLPEAKLSQFCAGLPIAKLSLFGSALTDRFGPDSDIDLLVEFTPNAKVGLFAISRMELELTDIVGRKVDLRTPGDLNPRFRAQVVSEARLIYVQR